MRYFVVSLLFLFVIVSCTGKKRFPLISYQTKVINLGHLTFRKEYTGKIKLKNIGDGELKITGTSSDCSCTIIQTPLNNIASGDSSFIEFKLTPAIDGFIQQSIFVNNNSINESRVQFLIRAKVKLI